MRQPRTRFRDYLRVRPKERKELTAIRTYSTDELRALARRSKDVNQSRRLPLLAAVRDGMDRGAASKIGGMDRQMPHDRVHRFNAHDRPGLRATIALEAVREQRR
jgi:hypothetical protein